MKVSFESLNMFCAPMIFILYIVLNILQGSVRQRNQDPGHQDEWPAPGSTGESASHCELWKSLTHYLRFSICLWIVN